MHGREPGLMYAVARLQRRLSRTVGLDVIEPSDKTRSTTGTTVGLCRANCPKTCS